MARLVSTNTELQVLRTLCSRNRKLAGLLLAKVDETYFHNNESVAAYQRIRTTITKSGDPPTWPSLLEDPSLDEGVREYLGEASVRLKTEAEAASAVKILHKYRQLRGLFRIGEDLLDKLQAKQVDTSTLIERVSDSLANLRVSRSMKDIALHIGKGNNSMEAVKNLLYDTSEETFIPTGFKDFDSKNGGFFLESLVTLGGSSGAGKSAMASQMCKFWASIGIRVVLVPLEMSKNEQTARLLANIAKVDIRKILLKKLSQDERDMIYAKFRRFAKKCAKLGGRYTIYKPEEDMAIEEILPVASTYGPQVIIIDYISLLKGVDGDDQWRKLGQVARYCKIYAANHNLIIVLLAQVGEDGRIRYSQAIKEHSNSSWIFVATKESRENKVINVEQLKGRNAELFPFSLHADLSTMTVGDLQQEVTDEPPSGSGRPKKRKYMEDLDEEE